MHVRTAILNSTSDIKKLKIIKCFAIDILSSYIIKSRTLLFSFRWNKFSLILRAFCQECFFVVFFYCMHDILSFKVTLKFVKAMK